MSAAPRMMCWATAMTVCLMSVRAADFRENFPDVPSGTLLAAVPGWDKFADEKGDTWVVSLVEDSGANSIEAPQPGRYRLHLDQRDAVIQSTDGPVDLSLKIKCTAKTDAYAVLTVDACRSDGVSGIGLRFGGGSQAGSSDNIVEASTGGSSWGDIQYRTLPGHWDSNLWYQVEIRDLDLSSGSISGKLTIFPVDDPKNKLVDNEELAGYGKAKVDQIDLLVLSSIGAARSFLLGDIAIAPASGRH